MISWGGIFTRQKLEKLLKLMTLTIGKWFLHDFLRGHFYPTKTWETSESYDPDHRKMIFTWFPDGPIFPEHTLRNFSDLFLIVGPEIIDVWSPQGSRTPGPSRNFSILRRILIQTAGPKIKSGQTHPYTNLRTRERRRTELAAAYGSWFYFIPTTFLLRLLFRILPGVLPGSSYRVTGHKKLSGKMLIFTG